MGFLVNKTRNFHAHSPVIAFFLLLILVIVGLSTVNRDSFNKKVSAASNTFTPQIIPFSDPEIMNPGRGLYKWKGNEYAPLPSPSKDVYNRFLWRDLETSQDNYQAAFDLIEKGATEAQSRGGKFWFGIYALCSTACKYNDYSVPRYIIDNSPKGFYFHNVYIPDWNDNYFLTRAEKLLNALGQKYNNDPRVGYIDIRIYGNWGEWHSYFSGNGFDGQVPYPSSSGAQAITTDTLKRIVRMHAVAFPNKQLLVLQGGSGVAEGVNYAMSLNSTTTPAIQRPIGWRLDCWGDPSNMGNVTGKPQWTTMQDRWKISPVTGEPCGTLTSGSSLWPNLPQQVKTYHLSLLGNGNIGNWNSLTTSDKNTFIDSGKNMGYRYVLNDMVYQSQVTTATSFILTSHWSNVGVAPTYDTWIPTVQLKNSSGSVVWEGNSTLNLKNLLPTGSTPVTQNDSFQISPVVPTGTYSLSLVVKDSQNYYKPMELAIKNRNSDGSYTIGTVTVTNNGTPTSTGNPSTTPTVTAIPTGITTCINKQYGDANCDNVIDLLDFEVFRSEYIAFKNGTSTVRNSDFNNDQAIDLLDFELFRQGFIAYRNGTIPPTPTVTPSVTATPAATHITGITNNQSVNGIINVSFAVSDTITTKVEFFVDSNLISTESFAPYELGGGNGFDTKALTNGTHTIKAVWYGKDGSTYQEIISFSVTNPTPTPSGTALLF